MAIFCIVSLVVSASKWGVVLLDSTQEHVKEARVYVGNSKMLALAGGCLSGNCKPRSGQAAASQLDWWRVKFCVNGSRISKFGGFQGLRISPGLVVSLWHFDGWWRVGVEAKPQFAPVVSTHCTTFFVCNKPIFFLVDLHAVYLDATYGCPQEVCLFV